MIHFLLLLILFAVAWPLALLFLAVWIPLLIIVAVVRLAALVLGIAAWAGVGAAILPRALARRRTGSPVRMATLCANCGAEVVEHRTLGWVHAGSAAYTCGRLQ